MATNLDRILPPYTRRANSLSHKLKKATVVTAILAFAVVMGFWIAIFSTFVVPIFVGIIGLLFLIALWMSDDVEPDLRNFGGKMLVGFFALSIIWPNYLAITIPGLPWLTPTRIVLALLTLTMLLQISQSRITRDHISGSIMQTKSAFIAYAVVQFCMLATFLIAPSPVDALSFVVQQLILWNLPLIALLWLFEDSKLVERLMQALAIALMIAMLFTLGEYRNKLPVWIPHIPSFLTVEGPQMQAFLTAQVRLDGTYRAKGTYGIHLYYSQLLLLMLPFAIHWILDALSPAKRGWAIAYVALLLVTIWMNNTRTATTGQLVVIAAMLGLYALRHYLNTRNKLDMTAPALAIGIPAVAAIGAMLIAISPRLQTMTIGGTQHAGSDAVRDGQWERAWTAVAKNPFGYGASQSGPITGRPTSAGTWIVDSTWINIMVDFGIIAAIAWVAFIGIIAGFGALIYLQRADRSADLCGPAAVAIGSFAMTMYTISYYGNMPFLMVMIAMVVTTRYRLAVAGKLARPKDIFQRKSNRPQPVGVSAA
jgi:hypothetical protein